MWPTSNRRTFRAIDDAPFVIFVLTWFLLAMTCAFLSYYIMFVPIPDPQVKDWNSFLDRFRRLEICLGSNSKGFQKTALDAKFRDFAILKPTMKNDSDHVFEMRNMDWFCSQNTSIFVLSFEVAPKMIGLIAESRTHDMKVGFIITHNQFEAVCNTNSTERANFTLSTCVHISGSSAFLPRKGHHEQCLNDQDPVEMFSNMNTTYRVLRPIIAPHVVKDGVLGELSAGNERRVCHDGGVLASPTFISDGEKISPYLAPETCRLISYRLLMSAIVLLGAIPFFVGCAHLCRRFDNSHLAAGQVAPISYTPVKLKPDD